MSNSNWPFFKLQIAQALSTRVDIMPEAYLIEFARLQDNVPTFSTVQARGLLEEGLGRPVDSVFEWLSAEPLASASLGQVKSYVCVYRSDAWIVAWTVTV